MPKLPGINHQRAVKAFEKKGFWIERQGKHIAMTDGVVIRAYGSGNHFVTLQPKHAK